MFFPSSNPATPYLADVRRVLVLAGVRVHASRLIFGESADVGVELDVGRVLSTTAEPSSPHIAVELVRMCGLRRASTVNLSPSLISVQAWFDTSPPRTLAELEQAHADALVEANRHPEGSEARRDANAQSDRLLASILDMQEDANPTT